jgi:thioredoxin-related protein
VRFQHLKLGEFILFFILVIGINAPIILMEHRKELHKVQFTEASLKDARNMAIRENKPIFIEIGTTWCFSCHRIRKQVYTHKDVGSFFNEHFVNIAMDKGSHEAAIWIELIQPKELPVLVIIDSMGNFLLSIQGFLKPEDLIQFGKTGLNRIHTNGTTNIKMYLL